MSGVIGSAGRFKQGIDFSGQQEIIKKAFSFKKSKNIAISINSPGGSPVQSHLIHDYIRQLAKKNKKKVIIFAEDVAASGGYLIACAGDEIYANQSSIPLSFFNFADLLFSTTSIKSLCKSNWILFNLSISSCFSSIKGSRVLLFFPAV